ncbi:MAG: sugar isomerase, partial [Erysipelotrichales bacterium]|nr:sugar isomerase [Erysipelotrichales bacterium]
MNCKDAKNTVISELSTVLNAVREEEIDKMAELICGAEKVFVVGVGRVLLMMQAFEKLLNHLGIDSYYVGEIN